MFHNPHYFVGFIYWFSLPCLLRVPTHSNCLTTSVLLNGTHTNAETHMLPQQKKNPNNGIQMAKFLAIQITPIILDLFNGLEFEPKGDPHHHVAVSEGPSAWLSIKDHIFSK